MVDGRLLHLSVGGLYDGLALLIDDETGTFWHHVTGEAVHGPLKGARMEIWPLEVTTVEGALERYPRLQISRSRPRRLDPMLWVTGLWATRTLKRHSLFPFGFRQTMLPTDSRRPELEPGLGLMAGDTGRFYPMAAIRRRIVDEWQGRPVEVLVGDTDGIPVARWLDDDPGGRLGAGDDRPLQMLTRWYGFSATFPGCEVYEEAADSALEDASDSRRAAGQEHEAPADTRKEWIPVSE